MKGQRNAGYALVTVLVGLVLLGLILEMAMLTARLSVHDLSADVTRTQLRLAADAGINAAILELLEINRPARLQVDGTIQKIQYENAAIDLSVQSEDGKIDLNGSNRPLLVGLFVAAGLDKYESNKFADRVMDWREPGQLKRLNGAKAHEYRAAGLGYGPRYGPFQTISELKLVLGMTPELYQKLVPAITVYNVHSIPELQTASPIALRAVGLDRATIAAIMSARAEGEIAPSENPGIYQLDNHIIGLPETVFTITAVVHQSGQVITRSETVLFTGNPKDPFWILALQ